jgi:hypothetical protein
MIQQSLKFTGQTSSTGQLPFQNQENPQPRFIILKIDKNIRIKSKKQEKKKDREIETLQFKRAHP